MIKKQSNKQHLLSDNSGFTIIESMVAMLTVAVLLTAISPVLVMSIAIRLQAKRIEKAAQLTNTFIDGIRYNSITPPGKFIELDPANKDNPRTLDHHLVNITKMPVPTESSATSNTNNDFYLAKKDGSICLVGNGCVKDSNSSLDEFYIQSAQIKVKNSNLNDGYRLIIRIYRADIDFNKTILASTDSVKNVVSPITSSMGNKQMPIIERIVDIANINTTFQNLCDRLGIAPIKDVNGVEENQNCPQ